MNKLMCKMFGHRHCPSQYSDLRESGTDGIGRVHGTVWAECERCYEKFVITHVHIPILEGKRDA